RWICRPSISEPAYSPSAAYLPCISEDLVARSVVLLPDYSAGTGLAQLTRCLKGCPKGAQEMARRRRAVANGPTRTPGNGGSGAGDQSGLTLVELVVTLLIIG